MSDQEKIKKHGRVRFGDYEADCATHELRKRGVRVALQHKPFGVLELLLRCPGQLVTRKELVAHLWPDAHVSYERSLNSAVNSLRLALGDSLRDCRYIETRPGLGYRFIAPVTDCSTSQNIEAHHECLKGRYLLDRMNEEDIYKALAYFNSALVCDSCVSLAQAGIADAHCQIALFGSMPPLEASCIARSAAESALSADSELALAHVAWGRAKMLFDWDWKAACAGVKRALDLDAKSAPAHILSASLACMAGDWAGAVETCQHALTIEPLSVPANLHLAASYYAGRNFDAAVEQCWKMLSIWQSFGPAQFLLALSYEQLGMWEEALLELQNARCCSACRIPATTSLAGILAGKGMIGDADEALAQLSNSRYVSGYWLAVAEAGRGNVDKAISLLERCFNERDPALLWLPADARFDFIRQSSQFGCLVARMMDFLPDSSTAISLIMRRQNKSLRCGSSNI